MGIIRTALQLRNPGMGTALSSIEVSALVDTGGVHLCIPEHLAIQPDLKDLERREATFANGPRITVPYVGPIEVTFKNRRCFTRAIVFGDEPLLGAIPMEEMDLVVVTSRQTVDVNPLSPNIPMSMAKQESVLESTLEDCSHLGIPTPTRFSSDAMNNTERVNAMFTRILSANRGGQPRGGAAAKPNRLATKACSGEFSPEVKNV